MSLPFLAVARPVRRLFASCAALAVLLSLAIPAGATVIVRVSDENLAAQADLVIEATVTDGGFVATDRGPATEYRLQVERLVAGSLSPTELETGSVDLRVPGGVDPETGEMLLYFGAPRFAPGERVLLLLESGADDTRRVLHLLQGVYRIVDLEGTSLAVRPFDDVHSLPMPGAKAVSAEPPRALDAFVEWLADRASGKARPADYFVELGAESALAEEIDRASIDAALARRAAEKFTFIEIFDRPVRWPQFDGGGSVTWRSHNGGQAGLTSNGHAEFQQALNAWNADGGSRINLRYGGQTGATAGLDPIDGQNVILFGDLANDISGSFSCTSGGTVATASLRAFSNATHTFGGQLYTTIAEADIATQNGIECFISSRSAAEIFGHELGHGIGLGHSCGDGSSGGCNTAAKNDALMRASIHNDGRGARLGSDDRAAIGVLYNQPSSAPAAPSNLSAANTATGVRLDWNDNSSNESTFRVERRAGNGSFSEIASTGANDDDFLDTTASTGTSYDYRVRARNGVGDSAYSNTAAITTSGERPPTNLGAQVLSPTRVRLDWTDNATAEVGFEVETNGFGVFVPAADLPANTTTVTLGGLNPSTLYQVRVRSVGGPNGNSSYSTVSFTLPAGTPEPCVSDDTTMCLAGDRFQVRVFWTDEQGVRGAGQVVPVDPTDSGLFYFFDEDNWELLIKVLDGCVFTDHFWVFAAATTDVQYTMVVTDTVTGTPAVYFNPLGNAAAAITDTSALPVCDAGAARTPGEEGEAATADLGDLPAGPTPQRTGVLRRMDEVKTAREAASELSLLVQRQGSDLAGRAPTKDCAADEDTMCLNDGRFSLEIDWTDTSGGMGSGKVVALPVGVADSGLFWFFDENNWEMLVKVLDACAINDRYWVLAAATTDVGYTLRITDTQEGVNQVYGNPVGLAADALIDTEAFATCP